MTLVAPRAPATRARARARRRASRPHRARDRGRRPRRTIGSRRAPPDAVDVWRPRPGQGGVPRRPSPARPGRFGRRPAICVANPRQGSVVHRRRRPHPRPGHGRGEHDLHQHVRQAHARPAVRASRARRDCEDAGRTRPRGRRVLSRLRGLSPGLAGVRREGGRLCDQAPSAWGGTVPFPNSSTACMCLPTRSPCSASSPSSAATFRRLTIVLAPKPWPSSAATSGKAGTVPAATCWAARSR